MIVKSSGFINAALRIRMELTGIRIRPQRKNRFRIQPSRKRRIHIQPSEKRHPEPTDLDPDPQPWLSISFSSRLIFLAWLVTHISIITVTSSYWYLTVGSRYFSKNSTGFLCRIPLDRRDHDAAAWRGLDPPPGPPRRSLLPHQGRPLDILGGGHEGGNLYWCIYCIYFVT